jgi:hypothetical protein
MTRGQLSSPARGRDLARGHDFGSPGDPPGFADAECGEQRSEYRPSMPSSGRSRLLSPAKRAGIEPRGQRTWMWQWEAFW